MRLRSLALSAASLALFAGCGGGSGSPEVTAEGPARRLPACAREGAPSPPPASNLPEGFPLPAGTLVTSSSSPHESQLVVVGVVPADLQEATTFFSKALPDRGYRVGVGDAEGAESEAPFTGNGYRGKWRVNELPGCPALKLTLVLIEQ